MKFSVYGTTSEITDEMTKKKSKRREILSKFCQQLVKMKFGNGQQDIKYTPNIKYIGL